MAAPEQTSPRSEFTRSFLTGSGAWTVVLAWDLFGLGSPIRPSLGTLAALLLLSAGLSAIFSVVRSAILTLERWAQRTQAHPKRLVFLTVLLLGLLPATGLAQFLTTGAWISRQSFAPVLRAALLCALALGWPLLWLWHREGSDGLSSKRRAALSTLALAAAAVLFGVITRVGRTYEPLSQFLVPALWLLGTTFGLWLIRPPRISQWAVRGLAGLLAGVTALALLFGDSVRASGRQAVQRAWTVELTARWLLPRAAGGARYSLEGFRVEDCATLLGDPVPQGPAREPVRSVILISVDTVRVDALEKSIGGRLVAPTLSGLRARTQYFRHAVTPYPATFFAVGSALTGWSPARLVLTPAPPPNLFDLSSSVANRRAAILPSDPGIQYPPFLRMVVGDTQMILADNADGVTDQALRWLEENRGDGNRILSWIHFVEPHKPYVEHPGFEFGPGQAYWSEVAYADHALGRLLEGLEQGGFWDDSVIVVFSDHGEALGERNFVGHHAFLNWWIADALLFVHVPGLPPERREELASLLDIAPTALAALGVPRPPGMEGVDLSDLKALADRRFVFSEAFPVEGSKVFEPVGENSNREEDLRRRVELLNTDTRHYPIRRSVSTSSWRYIVSQDTGSEELYNRGVDPKEEVDLSLSPSPELLAMRSALGNQIRNLSLRLWCRSREGG